MTLYINSCVRPDSRTDRLAKALLGALGEAYTEVKLDSEPLEPLSGESLALRTELLEKGELTHPMFRYARQFAEADTIVISAPFWDFGFPAKLKVYLEQVYVTGIVSRYGEDGMPVGLCRAKKLWYVATAGGPFYPQYSYHYLRDLCQMAFGIPEAGLVCAEGLDIVGNDPETILQNAIDGIPALLGGEEAQV